MGIALVTGSSSGFGLAIAEAFARRGDTVVATVRDPSRSNALQALITQQHLTNIEVRQLDVTSNRSIATAVGDTISTHGRIDVLVNNAGIGVVGALEMVDEGLLRSVFETNVFGAIAVTRAVLPHMRQQRHGRIVFMGAIGGILNTAYFAAYGATKHTIDGIAATWDVELLPFGIRVSSVLPSAFHTAIAGNMQAVFAEGTDYEAPTRRYSEALSGRINGGPTDLSPVVNAVIDAATSEQPRQRYLVAPHLVDVLGPVVSELEKLHQREISQTHGPAAPVVPPGR